MLPIFSNLYEKIICKQLLAFVLPYLNETQHGFLPQRSCLTNLSVILYDAINTIHTRDQLDVVHIDLLKAFDRVPHNLLLQKLRHRFGITGPAFDVLSSFLSDRKQWVVISGHASSWANVTSGVPQGSVLGPILFVLFIDDLHSTLSPYDWNELLFADDCKLYRRVSTVRDCIILQRALAVLEEWCLQNGLSPNIKKFGIISLSLREKNLVRFDYKLNDSVITRLNSINDLGVIFDSKLLFIEDIEKIKSKSMQLLGLLYRFTDIKSVNALRAYFINFVSPVLDYCSPIWSLACISNLNKLNCVLSFFFCNIVRKRVYRYREMSTMNILAALNIMPLHCRRHMTDLVYLHKIMNGKVRVTTLVAALQLHAPFRPTRQKNLFYVPSCRTSLEKRSLFVRVPMMYNALPNNVDITSSVSVYCSSLKYCLPVTY
jgi:hypothetical protein